MVCTKTVAYMPTCRLNLAKLRQSRQIGVTIFDIEPMSRAGVNMVKAKCHTTALQLSWLTIIKPDF